MNTVAIPQQIPMPADVEVELAAARRTLDELVDIVVRQPDDARSPSIVDEIAFARQRVNELAGLLALSRARHREPARAADAIDINDPPPLLTIRQAAALLNLSRRSIHTRIARGEIQVERLGTGPRAPIRIPSAPLLRAVHLVGSETVRRNQRQAEVERHRALAAVGGGK